MGPVIVINYDQNIFPYCVLFAYAGKPVYASERERILGQRARRTERLAVRAARRSRTLALAYSASIAGAYLLMAADTLSRAAAQP